MRSYCIMIARYR